MRLAELSPKIKDYTIKLLPLIAFALPLALLYLLNPLDSALKISPQDSFQTMWKGRTFELFFIWLVALEYILSWETIQTKINLQNKRRTLTSAVVLLLPSLFVFLEYSWLNTALTSWGTVDGLVFAGTLPIAVEYLVFSLLFCAAVFVSLGKKGLAGFALPALFVGLIGVIYAIDTLFPYGQFTPFQLLVPTTASFAGDILRFMGNTVMMGEDAATSMPTLQVTGALGTAKFAVAWPCAGIESLLIFTAVALLFLKRMTFSWKAKVGFFVFGAAVTYVINIFRIVSIFTVGMEFGVDSPQVQEFHAYYGPLYAVAWIVSFPLILLLGQIAWQKYRKPQTEKSKPSQPEPLNPA
jgi:thaumarchaeosortase